MSKIDESKLMAILEDVETEFRRRAAEKDEEFRSCHEGYGILLEEVDELWDEIKKKKTKRNSKLMREEAVQIVAIAMRFMHDLT